MFLTPTPSGLFLPAQTLLASCSPVFGLGTMVVWAALESSSASVLQHVRVRGLESSTLIRARARSLLRSSNSSYPEALHAHTLSKRVCGFLPTASMSSAPACVTEHV